MSNPHAKGIAAASAALIVIGAIVLVAAGVWPGCDSEAAPGPAEAPPPPPEEPEPGSFRHHPAEPIRSGTLLVDVSGSMRGFAAPTLGRAEVGGRARGRAPLASVHEALDAAFAEVGQPAPLRCVVGESIDCEGAPSQPIQYADVGIYRAGRSRLDSALRRAPVPERVDPDHPPAPDLLDAGRITVLVTDGMQVAGPAAPSDPTATAAAACTSGADPTCIAAVLRERTGTEGYGAWLFYVALPFVGRHYAERALEEAHRERTEAHLREVALDPRYNGIEFFVGRRLELDRDVGTSAFEYRGFKPLLVIVLARDHTLGRRFVENLGTRLRREPIHPGSMPADVAVRSMELAPLAPTPHTWVAIEAAPAADQQGIPAENRAEVRIRSSRREGSLLNGDVWCGARGKLLMYARWERGRAESPLPTFLTQQLALVGPRRDRGLPAGVGAQAAIRTEASAFRVGVDCTPLPVGVAWVEYEMRSSLALDEEAAGREWWAQESAVDTYEAPERVYGLRDLVLGVVRDRARVRKAWGRLRLRVERGE